METYIVIGVIACALTVGVLNWITLFKKEKE